MEESEFLKISQTIFLIVGSIVLYYYVWTLLAQQRRLKKFLLFELKESRKELKILLQSKELRNILND